MTQSVPRSSPVPRLLCLSLLLLFLLVPAQSWALLKLEIMAPHINHWAFRNQVSWMVKVVKTTPTEPMYYLAKLEAYVDGELVATPVDQQNPPMGPGLEYANWIYDGRQDGVAAEHVFTFAAWVWKSTMSPPLMIPQWEKVQIESPPPSTETLYNQPPVLSVACARQEEASSACISGIAIADLGSVTVTVQGQTVSVAGDGTFSNTVSLAPGTNSVIVVATDTANGLTTTQIVGVPYTPMQSTVSAAGVDFSDSSSVTFTVTPSVAATLSAAVWDVDHGQKVCDLQTDTSVGADEPMEVQWDGSAEDYFPYVCTNGRVQSGHYRLYASASNVDASGLAANEVTVTNDAQAPTWQALETESASTPLALSGTWQAVCMPEASGGWVLAIADQDSSPQLNYSFGGSQLGVVFVCGPRLGDAELRVDGSLVCVLSGDATVATPNCVYQLSGLGGGQHQLQLKPVVNASEAFGFALDCFRTY